jgi:hypothetical protein
MLTDLSSIALEWSKNYVRQRQTFKLNTKEGNVAPLAFQHDPEGTFHSLAAHLRTYEVSPAFDAEGSTPIIEPVDGEETDLEETRRPAAKMERRPSPVTARTDAPRFIRAMHETPETTAARKFKLQK